MSRMLGAAAMILFVASFGCSDGQETTVTVVEPNPDPQPTETETETQTGTGTETETPDTPGTQEGDMEIVTIRTNTQATIGDLRIGTGNIWEDTYETEGGNSATGLGAGVSVFVRGDESQNVRARVHRGDTLDVAGRRIEVREITDDAVVLAISR